MQEVTYNNDRRYPGPKVHPPPAHIKGIPTQAELDAFPRMFTWGELKEIVKSGDLERLMRNKALQARYDEWMTGEKAKYGSTENYLTRARLPWAATSDPSAEPSGTYDISASPTSSGTQLVPSASDIKDLTSSTNPEKSLTRKAVEQLEASHVATPGSGTSTPTSAGFVSLASLQVVNGKLRKSRSVRSNGSSRNGTPSGTPAMKHHSKLGAEALDWRLGDVKARLEEPEAEATTTLGDDVDDDEAEEIPVYLKYDPKNGLDEEKFAVLPNDWPYNTPYGVRHYCVWSRMPIAHPELVDYDPEAWARIEVEGLGGFTGVTPVRPFTAPPTVPSTSSNPSHQVSSLDSAGRAKFLGKLDQKDWYAADVAYAGKEMSEWAGITYESRGGSEVGNMVKGLWDPRGWECLWFVNPPRLQSVPGFSHFHVFARRKTPEEIDAAESFT